MKFSWRKRARPGALLRETVIVIDTPPRIDCPIYRLFIRVTVSAIRYGKSASKSIRINITYNTPIDPVKLVTRWLIIIEMLRVAT